MTWKKINEVKNIRVDYRKPPKTVTIQALKRGMWVVFIKHDYASVGTLDRTFKTRKQALKFARSYMRRH